MSLVSGTFFVGISLAKKAEFFELDPTGRSKDLPLHSGRHDKWDNLSKDIIKEYSDDLIDEYGKLDVPPIPKTKIEEILLDIEEDLKFEIEQLPSRVRLN